MLSKLLSGIGLSDHGNRLPAFDGMLVLRGTASLSGALHRRPALDTLRGSTATLHTASLRTVCTGPPTYRVSVIDWAHRLLGANMIRHLAPCNLIE